MSLSGRGRVFAAVAFLGSFLLFTLEIVVAKLLLPRFGGAAYVWTVSSMVFQGLLLAGYLYARAALARLAGGYWRVHAALLLLPVFFFPIGVRGAFPALHPSLQLIALLLLSIGVPFAVLSTTSPVTQDWLRRSTAPEAEDSYFVFGASNTGALAALLAYPTLIEPYLTTSQQCRWWCALYFVYAVLQWFLRPQTRQTFERQAPLPRSSFEERLIWAWLALGPSAALLAATNLLTLDFAAVPLLWIVPLAIYLLTFILNFKREPWYPKRLSMTLVWLMLAWFATVLVTVFFSADVSERFIVIRRLWVINKFLFYNAALFIVCLICHRALALSKPPAERSPQFYVWLSAGGWLGSVLVGLVMPVACRRIALPELDWAVAGALAFGALLYRDRLRRREVRLEEPGPSRSVVWALAFVGLLGLALYMWKSPAFRPGNEYSLRNFYGYYRVVDEDGLRKFYHGNTLHGLQYLDPAKQDEPLLYFHRGSPIAEVFDRFGGAARRVGVLGLGSGVLGAYGRAGQLMDFYELDPDVIAIAKTRFTFLSRSKATTRAFAGDARLSVEAEPTLAQGGRPFDILVKDVFSGGAIPVHMVTREALRSYFARMPEDGVLAVQVTNRFLNMRPVFAALAADGGYFGCAKMSRPGRVSGEEKYYSSWIALSRSKPRIAQLESNGWLDLSQFSYGVRPWTDDYAPIWSALGGS